MPTTELPVLSPRERRRGRLLRAVGRPNPRSTPSAPGRGGQGARRSAARADLRRVRRSEAVCQCELIALFEIRQSLLSHHVKRLVDAGLLDVERRHKWAYYSVSTDGTKELTAWLT